MHEQNLAKYDLAKLEVRSLQKKVKDSQRALKEAQSDYLISDQYVKKEEKILTGFRKKVKIDAIRKLADEVLLGKDDSDGDSMLNAVESKLKNVLPEKLKGEDKFYRLKLEDFIDHWDDD